MEKEFKKLFGNRVYLEMPKEDDKKIILDSTTKKAVEQEFIKKMIRLKIYAVGDSVIGLKEGDEICADMSRSTIIPLSENRKVIMVSAHDIIHLW